MATINKLWLLLWLVIAADGASNYGDGFEYPFVTPEPYHPAVNRPNPNIPAWQYFYPPNHDFTDYSQHITRTDPASRNSGAQLIPSGPYFAQELKTIYHKRPVEPKVYQTSWNMIDSNGNEVTVYNRPVITANRPSPPFEFPANHPVVMEGWQQQQQQKEERPIRKPISKKPLRKKQKVRPIHPDGYNQHSSKPSKHPNNIDKMADGLGAQSIASAYPNGVMGTLSLMAGIAWYLINKSATPVVKMRQHSDSNPSENYFNSPAQNAINQLAEYWLGSLKQTDCQQRAVCELVSQSQWLLSATRWGQSAYKSPVVQKAIESLEEESVTKLDDHSKLALLVRAASHGERGVDCAAFYPHCPLPFREEARDRRR